MTEAAQMPYCPKCNRAVEGMSSQATVCADCYRSGGGGVDGKQLGRVFIFAGIFAVIIAFALGAARQMYGW
jgi:hypothetical protein